MSGVDPTVAGDAAALVCGDRCDAYEGTTERICALWEGYLGRPVSVEDYYALMALMKVGRSTGPYSRDSYVDAVGYLLLAEGAHRETRT